MRTALKGALRSAPAMGTIALLALFSAASLPGQNTPTMPTTAKTAPAKAKPAAAVTPAKPAGATTAKPAATQAATPQPKPQATNSAGLVPAASRTAIQSAPVAAKPNVPTAPAAVTATTPSAAASATTPAAAPAAVAAPQATTPVAATPATSWSPTAPAASTTTGARAPVAGQGVGTILWQGGWTLIAYGCFRSDTRLFCDFDTTNQNNVQVGANIWSGAGGVNLVDDGGKITPRHNAFFVGQDGTQFPTAYISPQQPVRFIIEYDDVDPRYTSVSIVLARERIQGVPVFPIDPSQPAGKMPARTAVTASAATPGAATQQATQPGGTGALDKATGAVNTANDQKKKAQSLWKSLQGAVQSH